MDVELNGWKEYRVRSKRHDLDLNATSGHDPVDFGKLLTFKDFSLGHQEAGARATGRINGIPFNGVGLRDRSFGPRPMGGVGAVKTVILVSQDLPSRFAANLAPGSKPGLIKAHDTHL